MKIGILTFHRSINYGAFMQCYALSNELLKRYPEHQVEVIDFEYKHKHDNYRKSMTHLLWGRENFIKYQRFQSDLRQLPLSKETFITNEIDGVCDFIKQNYDIVIVGSDAVWTYQDRMPVDNPYFLFGNKLSGVIKMSYAASAFSTRFENILDYEKEIIKDRLSDFYYIGVRDEATHKFIHSLGTGKTIDINHDPTFFLQPADNDGLAKKALRKNCIFSEKKSISFMTRNMQGMDRVRNELSDQYNLLHFYRRNNNWEDLFDSRCRFLYNVSPLEWYNLYGQMSLNITNFFHGICIGIINHIPTIVIDDFKQEYMSKYAQLMTDLKLTDRLFYKKDFDLDVFLDTVHYCLTHKEEEAQRLARAIADERKKSSSFFLALDKLLV